MFRRSHSPLRLRRPVGGGVLHQLHAKMNRLPAHLTREDDWRQDQPGVRLSRVFGVVLGIHLVAIGGLMAYEMFRHRDQLPTNTAALRQAPREARPSAAAAPHARAVDTFADDPAHDGLRKHVVAPGERLADIAAQYQVDENALMVLNRLGENRPFQSGLKLVVPNRKLMAGAPILPSPLAAGTATVPEVAAGPGSGAAGAPAGDGLVPVDPPPYDPSLPTRKAEPVEEAGAARASASGRAGTRPGSTSRTSTMAESAPKKQVPPARKPTETAAAKPKAKGRVHVVKDGDTAYRIAKRYGVNVDQLIKANGIKPNALRPGTTLTIPAVR